MAAEACHRELGSENVELHAAHLALLTQQVEEAWSLEI